MFPVDGRVARKWWMQMEGMGMMEHSGSNPVDFSFFTWLTFCRSTFRPTQKQTGSSRFRERSSRSRMSWFKTSVSETSPSSSCLTWGSSYSRASRLTISLPLSPPFALMTGHSDNWTIESERWLTFCYRYFFHNYPLFLFFFRACSGAWRTHWVARGQDW